MPVGVGCDEGDLYLSQPSEVGCSFKERIGGLKSMNVQQQLEAGHMSNKSQAGSPLGFARTPADLSHIHLKNLIWAAALHFLSY